MLTRSGSIYCLIILIQEASPANRKLRKVALILAQMHDVPSPCLQLSTSYRARSKTACSCSTNTRNMLLISGFQHKKRKIFEFNQNLMKVNNKSSPL